MDWDLGDDPGNGNATGMWVCMKNRGFVSLMVASLIWRTGILCRVLWMTARHCHVMPRSDVDCVACLEDTSFLLYFWVQSVV